MPEGENGTPARVISVHRERYELVCEHGTIYGVLKPAVYFHNRSESIPADDNPALLMSIAVKPLAEPPFPLAQLERGSDDR